MIVNGVAIRAAPRHFLREKREVTTLEGLAVKGKAAPAAAGLGSRNRFRSAAFVRTALIMTAKALLDKNPNPTDMQIRDGMENTLCRCMTYYRIQAAIRRAAKTMADARPASKMEVVA